MNRKAGHPPTYDRPRRSIAARLQTHLHDQIKSDAEAAGRSISEEIERRLEQSCEKTKVTMSSATLRKPSDIVHTNLRIREHLRSKLETAARKRSVSLNTEMLHRLEQSFNQGAEMTLEEIAADMRRMMDALAKTVQSSAATEETAGERPTRSGR